MKMDQVQAAQDINEEYREELQAVSAKNILRRVDVHLAAQPGLIGDAIRLVSQAIGDGVPHRYSHKARLKRSELLLKSRQYEAARHDCQQCLMVKPDDARTNLLLAEALSALGEHREAKAAYYKSVAAGPRDSGRTLAKEAGEIGGLHQRGNASFQEGRFREAVCDYTEALRLLEEYQCRRPGPVRMI